MLLIIMNIFSTGLRYTTVYSIYITIYTHNSRLHVTCSIRNFMKQRILKSL